MPPFRNISCLIDFIGKSLPAALLVVMLGTPCATALAGPPIIQPGAPGEPSRQISAEEAIKLAGISYSAADLQFMRDMIPHHQQALDMTELVADRTSRNRMIELAQRIEASQKDEIDLMSQWLRERDEDVPDTDWRGHAHAHHHTMEGMATEEEMEQLEQARGDDFDRLFLELMIEHHRGALVMVEDLLEHPGAARDPELFEFTTDVTNDQEAEIDRMTAMLAGFSPDPRVGLAAGFRDAGTAAWNMELLASLPKPDGFYDPENPAGLPKSRLQELEAKAYGDTEVEVREDDDPVADEDADERQRPALLDFANSDMAFGDGLLVVGNYHGFNLYDTSKGETPELLSSVVCPGGQGDVSVAGDLLIMSAEQIRGRVDCGLKGVAGKVSDERFRGLRIFDISDVTHPRQVGAVQTCRGSHTHTIVAGPEEDGRLIIYNSATSVVRDDEELEGCLDKDPYRDEGTALFRIDVIEVPVDDPAGARIIHSPAVFADPETGVLAGLWERGDHGPDTQTTSETNHCHDITVFPERNIAAGACSGNGILFDISDPVNPERIDEVVDPGFAYWHSATFSNDGSTVIFTDEWGGGTRPRCRASDPMTWGANAIYDIVDNELVFRSYYKMPAPQTEQENCVAHNGSLVPVPGRDIMVQAWYQGGISVFDFSDPAKPEEIAFFDRGPIDETTLVTGGFWSAYWYQGRIFGSEIIRGLDVLSLTPSEYLSENEIAAAELVIKDTPFNPQQQLRVSWPDDPVVARAYMDQLLRAGRIGEQQYNHLDTLLDRANDRIENNARDTALAGELAEASGQLAESARDREGLTRKRMTALAETLEGIEARL